MQRDQFPSFLPTAAHHESHERKDAVDNLLQMHIHSNTVTMSTWSNTWLAVMEENLFTTTV